MKTKNKMGERGQPWRRPTPTEKTLDLIPGMQTQPSPQALVVAKRICCQGSEAPQNAPSTDPATSPDQVSSWPCQLSTDRAEPCFPFQSHLTNRQKLSEASQKSFSMTSPDNRAQKAFFFSLMASFISDVHHWVGKLPSRQAPMTF